MKNEELAALSRYIVILHSSFIILHLVHSAGENQVKNMAEKMA